jgi:electron transfer flavoprotein alpha/beta subunit
VRIAVCVAAVPNPEKVKWDRFRQLLDLQDAEPVLNPADRNALELAAQLAKSSGATFDVYSAGSGASAALREAAVFGAQRLIAISDPLLETADEAGVAGALAAAIAKEGGADVVVCGPQTMSYGSGAVAGYLSSTLGAGLRADVVGLEIEGADLRVTQIDGASVVRSNASTPLVVAAAPYGIATRTISPILLMRASKKPVEELTLADASNGRINSAATLPNTGVADGPLESNRKKRANEIVDGPDAAARAITLVGALRDRQLV